MQHHYSLPHSQNYTGGSSLPVQGPRISTTELSQFKQNKHFFPSFYYKLISMTPPNSLCQSLVPNITRQLGCAGTDPMIGSVKKPQCSFILPLWKDTSKQTSSRHELSTTVIAWTRPAHNWTLQHFIIGHGTIQRHPSLRDSCQLAAITVDDIHFLHWCSQKGVCPLASNLPLSLWEELKAQSVSQ